MCELWGLLRIGHYLGNCVFGPGQLIPRLESEPLPGAPLLKGLYRKILQYKAVKMFVFNTPWLISDNYSLEVSTLSQ